MSPISRNIKVEKLTHEWNLIQRCSAQAGTPWQGSLAWRAIEIWRSTEGKRAQEISQIELLDAGFVIESKKDKTGKAQTKSFELNLKQRLKT